MRTLEQIKNGAFKAHRDTNHLYAGVYPYELHLNWAVSVADRFIYLLPEAQGDLARGILYWHDAMEDARQNYNDIVKATGIVSLAEGVLALTNFRGRTRDERAPKEYYDYIKQNVLWIFCKMCDRAANMEFGGIFGGTMLQKNRDKMEDFLSALDADIHFPEFADYLRTL